MRYPDHKALKNSFAAVKKDINEIKATNSLIDLKLKNSFSNIKKDMDHLKKSVEDVKDGKKKSIELAYLNERLGKMDSAIKRIDIPKDFESDLNMVKSQLKALDEAVVSKDDFENVISSLKEELDSKLEEIKENTSKPAIKKESVKTSKKKKDEKGTFSKMIDFFSED